jgi:DNA-directed RNA polymerase specialized sigma24 family protein
MITEGMRMNGRTMSATAEMQITTFNTLAMRFQDDAYTLAYYLLADETRAAQATEAAFVRLYRWPGLRTDQFRLQILRKVVASSRKAGGSLSMSRQGEPLSVQMQRLNFEERAAAVLVDVLALSYEDTASAMDTTREQVARLLAQARIALSQTATVQQPTALSC